MFGLLKIGNLGAWLVAMLAMILGLTVTTQASESVKKQPDVRLNCLLEQQCPCHVSQRENVPLEPPIAELELEREKNELVRALILKAVATEEYRATPSQSSFTWTAFARSLLAGAGQYSPGLTDEEFARNAAAQQAIIDLEFLAHRAWVESLTEKGLIH